MQRTNASLKRMDAKRRAASADVARAETSLQTMQAEARIAREEFKRLNPGEPVPPLVGKAPQLAETAASLEAAKAKLDDVDAEELELRAALLQAETALRQAEINLQRTKIVLPGDASQTFRVARESVEVGQTVAPTMSVGELYDATRVEIPVSLDWSLLQFLNVGGSDASVAMVMIDGEQLEGRVARTEGEIDQQSRQAEVVVELDVPSDRMVSLSPGRFVRVRLIGEPIENVVELPRTAVQRDVDDLDAKPFVYLANVTGSDQSTGQSQATLTRKAIDVVRLRGETAVVRGLEEGEQVVLTRLDVAGEGMAIQFGAKLPADDEPAETTIEPSESESE